MRYLYYVALLSSPFPTAASSFSDLSLFCLWFLMLNASKHAICSPQQQDDSLEKVIKDTESLFKSREKEYQETIDQIEVRGGGGEEDMAQKDGK